MNKDPCLYFYENQLQSFLSLRAFWRNAVCTCILQVLCAERRSINNVKSRERSFVHLAWFFTMINFNDLLVTVSLACVHLKYLCNTLKGFCCKMRPTRAICICFFYLVSWRFDFWLNEPFLIIKLKRYVDNTIW